MPEAGGWTKRWIAAGAAMLLATGCAGFEPGAIESNSLDISHATPSADAVSATGLSLTPAKSSPPFLVKVSDGPVQFAQALPLPAARAEELIDPFSESGEGGEEEEYDPWEPFNAKVFEFNRQLDRWALKPVAQGYNFVVPNAIQVGVSNIIHNVRFPSRFINNLFQRKVKGAGIEASRFLVNSTLGLGGFWDVAKDLDLITPEEDTGQTLGFYGVKPGPYLVLPFLQPYTVRDLIGYVADVFMNPLNWLVAPIIEVNGIPSAIPHTHDTTILIVQMGARAFEILNERSLNLEKYQGVEEATLDLYTAVRNAYLQKRARLIRE